VAQQLEIDFGVFTSSATDAGDVPYSLPARTVRWVQQTLKTRGLIERDATERGVWRLTPKGKLRLNHVGANQVLVAFHTRLGLALLADCRTGMLAIDEPISLCLTSPPYPLSKEWGRGYGSPRLNEYVDFVCEALEPIVHKLAPGGSVAMNISNDVFEPGRPSRSLYVEYLTIALNQRLGLSLMDRVIWRNPTKPPGPCAWSSLKRIQLNVGYEPILVFCNDPLRSLADNRRVLEPHTERHLRLIAAGGERAHGVYADGAHVRRPGAFAAPTAGRVPKNVIDIAHGCSDQRRYKQAARKIGLPVHGAPYPLKLAEWLIGYLSDVGQLVVDPFGGSQTTARAAENLSRRWVTTEIVGEYARGGALRFGVDDELWINPDLDLALAGRLQGSQLPAAT
jgi:site-specific DNA-methyltransferase (cytosine-N4-specific)